MKLRVTLDEVLEERNMTQKDLINLIKEKLGVEVRAASISELYNNQRKSLNIKLIEQVAEALEIEDIGKLLRLEKEL
jgi:putative transcriptional regulator